METIFDIINIIKPLRNIIYEYLSKSQKIILKILNNNIKYRL